MKSWPKGADPATAAPSKDDTFRLIEIKASADGGRILCKADVLIFFKPTVKCTVNAPTADSRYTNNSKTRRVS